MSGQPLSHRHHLGTGVVLVLLGGVLGTLLRYGVESLLPPRDGFPWGTLTANVTGAFALGALLETLAQRGPESRVGRRIRLVVGTGVLGGYTTYSTYAVEADRLLAGGEGFLTAAYVGLTLLAGLGAAAAGVWLAAGRRLVAEGQEPVDPDTDRSEWSDQEDG
ncbi:MAG: CrcB family protein [Actinomycetota bacterium]|nr:CrcB family protein [Actinomycetota bacterium]